MLTVVGCFFTQRQVLRWWGKMHGGALLSLKALNKWMPPAKVLKEEEPFSNQAPKPGVVLGLPVSTGLHSQGWDPGFCMCVLNHVLFLLSFLMAMLLHLIVLG